MRAMLNTNRGESRVLGLCFAVAVLLSSLTGCGGGGETSTLTAGDATSCMQCHNGSQHNDYTGPGIENPHPFTGADKLSCVDCHGGNPNGTDKLTSHVPAPPQIGDKTTWTDNNSNWFNRLTLTGIDKMPDYQVGGVNYTALEYLQFVQPGDLRVVQLGRSCGACHDKHAEVVARSIFATGTGLMGDSMYFVGVDNAIPAQQGLFDNTASDHAARPISDPNYVYDPQNNVARVQNLIELPVWSKFGATGNMDMFRNNAYSSLTLGQDLLPDNRVATGSKLQNIWISQVDNGCGNCHLNSTGANNRYGDFRGSGCTVCHMPYSKDGKSGSKDPNVNKLEPVDPDDIDAPEVAHVKSHRISSIAKVAADGTMTKGIDDYACAGCHQNANRDVLQFWGIRLDQNQDLRNGVQYPANPVTFQNTVGDTRLYDPAVGNNTFNGRNANQHILKEDYDGDGRDDTPPDVHYEAGMGCIDCHGSYDLHGGDTAGSNTTAITSHMETAVAISCESCHGTIAAYAPTQQGIASDGTLQTLAVDTNGKVITHVRLEADGNYYMYSRLTGAKHFVSQTKDVVVDSGKLNPYTSAPLFNAKASYAMGRDDGNPANGTGPKQTNAASTGFSHTDNMNCATCHSSWSNTCVGCHLKGRYNEGANFSNITGERTVYQQTNADFVYDSPLMFQLGVDTKNKINQYVPNTKVFFQYQDRAGNQSQIFTWTDRNGDGNNPSKPFGSAGHNKLMQHSIRGKVNPTKEGPRYCVTCHLTQNSVATFGTEYDTFRTAIAARNYGVLDYNLLKTHFGKNTGNQLDSPMWVHMVAGLGSGMFLFDQNGSPVNPLDTNANRIGANGVAPASVFDPANVTLDLDRVVDESGFSFASNTHSMLHPGVGPNLRDGAADPTRPGPLGATLLRKLADPVNGIVLDSWIDANGAPQGDGATHIAGN